MPEKRKSSRRGGHLPAPEIAASPPRTGPLTTPGTSLGPDGRRRTASALTLRRIGSGNPHSAFPRDPKPLGAFTQAPENRRFRIARKASGRPHRSVPPTEPGGSPPPLGAVVELVRRIRPSTLPTTAVGGAKLFHRCHGAPRAISRAAASPSIRSSSTGEALNVTFRCTTQPAPDGRRSCSPRSCYGCCAGSVPTPPWSTDGV
jgi:hypothetical protein